MSLIERAGASSSPIPNTGRVLILSQDAVAAALIGALVETLGYQIQFRRPPESTTDCLRRIRPSVALIDCDDPDACSDETLGRAAMLRVSVVIFGTRDQLDRVRVFALEHDIDTILMPPRRGELEEVLRRAQAG